MPTFTINDHKLYYETHGSPDYPPLVIFHQGLGTTVEWRPQVEYFSQHFYTIAFDRWGYGQSDNRRSFPKGYMLNDAMEAIALFEHLGIRQANVIGHSDGGTVALLLAIHRPDLVRAMVTEAAHIYHEPRIYHGIKRIIDMVESGEWAEEYLIRLHGEEKAKVFIENYLPNWADKNNFPEFQITEERLHQITCPVLVIQGEEDEYALPQHAIDMHNALLHSTLWLIPDCGHTPHVCLKNQFNEQVTAFFAE